MVSVKSPESTDTVKAYFAEVRNRIGKKEMPALNIISDFYSDICHGEDSDL